MKIRWIIVVVLGLFVQPAMAGDLPVPNAAYSGKRVMASAGFSLSGQIYHDRGKERWEPTTAGMSQVTIMRPDLGKLLMLMPQLNMAMEMPLGEDGSQFSWPVDHGGEEPEVMGRELVAGESTTKYRTEVDDGANGIFTVISWVTDDGIVMRMEGEGPDGKFAMYLEGMKRGPQDAALFEVPAGVPLMPVNPALLNQFK